MESKRRIAIIIPGGIGTGHHNMGVPALERLVKLLAHDFRITVFQLSAANTNYSPEGFELVSIISQNRFLKSLKLLLAFRKLHRQEEFKIVHGFWIRPGGFLAALIGKIWGMKSIVSVQGGDAIALPEINYGQLRHPLLRKISFWALRNASALTSLTLYLAHNLSVAGFTGKDFNIIPFGVDPAIFKFHDKHIVTPVKILHIGNLHPVKDQSTLLEAFKIISEKIPSELTIIGEGPAEANLRKMILRFNLVGKVSILHPMPYEALPAYYDKADIMLHTSLSEGQAVVVAEAMSSGVLVCGTKVGLLYDLPDCCVAVPVGDHKKLGAEVIKLLGEFETMREKRKNAGDWSKVHTIHWTANEFKRLYNS